MFWRSTPRELFIHFDAAAIKAEREHKARAWHAWHVAVMSKARKMPTLASLTGAKAAAEQQTGQEQRNVARMLTIMYGGTVSSRSESPDA